MGVNGFHRLAVKLAAAFRVASRKPYRDWHRNIRAPILCPGVIENLIQRGTGEIRELHLDDWPHPVDRGPNGGPYHRVLADRRIQYAVRKFFGQTFGCFECASKSSADVLPVNENAFIVA